MASKRHQRRKECDGKERFGDMEAAREKASFVYHISHGKELHPYRCHFCGSIHLGHMPGGVRAAINRRRAA